MDENISIIRDIHKFVRGRLPWDQELQLLEKVVESPEWLDHLEMDMQLYYLAKMGMNVLDVEAL